MYLIKRVGVHSVKKIVVSFIVGFLLAIGASVAYAEVQGMIGKRIDGQFPLKVGDQFTDIPAITIEGVSYIPLRAAGELFGATVAWIDGEISMIPNQKIDIREDIQEAAQREQEEFERQSRERTERIEQYARARNEIKSEIELLQFKIKHLQREIQSREEGLKNPPLFAAPNVPYEGSDLQKKHQEDLANLKAELADLEAQLAELETQLAELEKNKPEELK
jgi:hypothetical protein